MEQGPRQGEVFIRILELSVKCAGLVALDRKQPFLTEEDRAFAKEMAKFVGKEDHTAFLSTINQQ